MLRFKCPGCQSPIRFEESRSGTVFECQQCGGRFTTPSQAEVARLLARQRQAGVAGGEPPPGTQAVRTPAGPPRPQPSGLPGLADDLELQEISQKGPKRREGEVAAPDSGAVTPETAAPKAGEGQKTPQRRSRAGQRHVRAGSRRGLRSGSRRRAARPRPLTSVPYTFTELLPPVVWAVLATGGTGLILAAFAYLASAVLGIAAGIAGLAAVILGVVALKFAGAEVEAEAEGELQKTSPPPQGWAWAGLLMGVVGLLSGVTWYVLWTYSLFPEKLHEGHEAACRNLLAIAQAQEKFREEDRDGDGEREYAFSIGSHGAEVYRQNLEGRQLDAKEGNLALRGTLNSLVGAKIPLPSERLADAEGLPGIPSHFEGYRFLVLHGPESAPAKWYVKKEKGHVLTQFGLCAYPAGYGKTGIYTFVLSEDGSIRRKDNGGRPVLGLPEELGSWDSAAEFTGGETPSPSSAPAKTEKSDAAKEPDEKEN